MRPRRAIAAAIFAVSVVAGTLLDARFEPAPRSSAVLVADLHVHPYPGDGSLPTWELQREAARRGIDVLAVTGHNNRFGLDVGRLVAVDPAGPILLPGQELTTPSFHMAAVGIETLIDWRLSAREAIDAIHAQGGVAIAAHPLDASWREDDPEVLKAVDGVEVAHPIALGPRWVGARLRWFYNEVHAVNPDVAPIGSTDFHMIAPLGLCRTYLLVDERSAAAALDAIRRGRTVAHDANGRLIGTPPHVSTVEAYLAATPARNAVSQVDRLLALTALLSLVGVVVTDRS